MDETRLEKYRTDYAFLRLMIEQTVKDFGRMGFELRFDEIEPPDFNLYCLQLAPQLSKWCMDDKQKLMAVMYHIDLPDHFLAEGINCKKTDHLSQLILQRELIKVVLKKLYTD
jgi:hypothetical protein